MFTPTTLAVTIIIVAFFVTCIITAVSSHVRDVRRARWASAAEQRMEQRQADREPTCDNVVRPDREGEGGVAP